MKLSYTLEQLKSLFPNTEILGHTTTPITGIAALDTAKPGDLAFLSNPKYRPQVPLCNASLILVPLDYEGSPKDNQAFIKLPDPSLALTHICSFIESQLWPHPKAGIHPSAFIHPSANVHPQAHIGPMVSIGENSTIGKNTSINASCVIGNNVSIGDSSTLMPNVTIMDYSIIGNNVRLHPGSVIGSDGFGYITQDAKHLRVPQVGNVILQDFVEIGANTTIDRARFDSTRIGQGTKIDNLVQIGHNVQIGNHCIIVSQTGIAGSTIVEDYVVIGGQVGIVGHIRIGKGSQIGSQSGISNDLPPGSKVRGYPPLPISQDLRINALKKRLPEFFKRLETLESTIQQPLIPL